MSVARRILLFVIVIAAIGAVAVVYVRREIRARQTVLTDGQGIREPLRDAAARRILWQPGVTLEGAINTRSDEYEPRLSADGSTLFFVRGKPSRNADIYIAHRTPGDPGTGTGEGTRWSEPVPLDAVNSPADELGPEPSPDGTKLHFYSNREGGQGGYDLWVSVRDDQGGWSAPVNLGPAVNSAYNEYGVASSSDGRTLYFSSNRPRGQGESSAAPVFIPTDAARRDYDIYSVAIDVAPGVPPVHATIVPGLDTTSNEGTPAMSPAGDFLYFASDRSGGYGGFDLYRSRVRDGVVLPPENLGLGVNTAAHELDPAPSMGGYGLHFSSDRVRAAARDADAPQAEREPDYNLYYSFSREVFEEIDPTITAFSWEELWPLLWSTVLALLALLLLLAMYLFMRGRRYRALSLLAKCLLISALIHCLLMFLFMVWEVTTGLSDMLEQGQPMRVALTTSSGGESLTGQIRGMESAEFAPASRPVDFADPMQVRMKPPEAAAAPTPEQDLPDRAELSETALTFNPNVQIEPSREAATAAEPPPTAIAMVEPPSRESQAMAVPADAPVQEARAERALDGPVGTPTTSARQAVTESAPVTGPVPIAPAVALTTSDVSEQLAPANVDVRVASSTASAQVIESPTLPTVSIDLPVPGLVSASEATAPMPSEVARASPGEATERAVAFQPASAASTSARQDAPASIAQATSVPTPATAPDAAAPARAEAIGAAPSPASAITLEVSQPPALAATAPWSLPEPVDSMPAPESSSTMTALPDAQETTTPITALVERTGSFEPIAAAIGAAARSDIAARAAAPAPATSVAVPALSAPKPTEVPKTDTIAGAMAAVIAPSAAPSASAEMPEVADVPLPHADPTAGLLAAALAPPTEVAAPVPTYEHREPEKRVEVLEKMGGSEATERAVALALDWLAKHQHRDGKWDSDRFDEGCGRCGGEATYDADVATTGLALLCFLGSDHTHKKEGPYRENVERAIAWLIAQQQSNGDVRGRETMYSQGIATIALAEAYGMTRDEHLLDPVAKAVRFIVRAHSQTHGGWRYDPGQPGDTSVFGWQIMAMTSARRAGIEVPPELIDASRDWLDRVSTVDLPGHYAYQPEQPPTVVMTAEGLFAQQLLGRARDEHRMQQSVEFVMRNLPTWRGEANTYYWYYATLAMFQNQGDDWKRWNDALTTELLNNQVKEGVAAGSWDPADRWATIGGRIYQTALCTLCLEVYYRYLPMYAEPAGAQAAAEPATPPDTATDGNPADNSAHGL